MRLPKIYNPETDQNVNYGEGTLLLSIKGNKLMKCIHFDSKDTILEEVATGKQTKPLNSMTLNRYYVKAVEGYNYEA